MIRIINELSDILVEIESDKGWFLDIGGDVVKRLKLTRPEIQYVEELSPEEAEIRKQYYIKMN